MPANQHHTEYAPPVLRAPSPASSIGTTYGADQTSFSDTEDQIDQYSFEQKWEERLALNLPRPEEQISDQEPLLPRPPPDSEAEQLLFERITAHLRHVVHNLEDNELFERTLLRGSQAGLEPLPSTNDIDALMRSMMVSPTPAPSESNAGRGRSGSRTGGTAQSPWLVNGQELQLDPDESLLNAGTIPGKRSRNGSRRN